MKDAQNKFYSSISDYYSEIFPYKPAQLQFVKNQLEQIPGKKVLDIGCATGELSYRLAKEGAKVTGIDLNPDLIAQAKSSRIYSDLHFQVGNMLELTNDFQSEWFDAVLCFGNTLVHLTSPGFIQNMMEEVKNVLKPGGKFLLQILNYDYILNENVTELPLIETENIRFIRNYIFEENNPLVKFQTELVLKKEGKTVHNETSLLALRSEELKGLFEETGFKNLELFSNFSKEPFGGKHLPLVVSADK
ncbi:Methyltransferase domain-containing protein [Tangfeifania diversioriginum]|uniref:Methyltransferase domain-containing protein n=1 Tax=Tangfeifania diversioriginum TaxID=1168035 RepID=A0A1M6IZ56_9BACT|nr:class I SAM-dependent methyltransferase [Tangfeifania diversioriginum]SHJ39680.1 Methyltransferase domain-containing protein [Tangfeifania diversioriginum]